MSYMYVYVHIHSHALSLSLSLSLSLLLFIQRLSQMGVVVFIVVGLFMFTYKSTSFDAEGFILVSYLSVCLSV